MDYPKSRKFSSHLVLTAVLSGGITITLAIIYMFLSIMAIIFRFTECTIPTTTSSYFWTVITAAYIREGKNCGATDFDITPAYTVFILAVITLTVSVLCLVSACVLIATMKDEGMSRYLTMVVTAYIGTNVASLIVDLTTAAHFGIDHSTLTSKMEATANTTFDEIYVIEVLRQGALILMSVGLKGYVILVINWILIILLIVYLFEHRKLLKTAEHSIHKMGALNAFDQPRRPDDSNWATNSNPREPETFSPFARGPQVNNGFRDGESDRGARRSPMRTDTHYSNRSDDRSDSWQRGQPSLAQQRPFSYLEDFNRPPVVPARPPPSPAVEAPWTHRDPWQQPQGPPVPAPDYSPQPRRLKSALKPGGQW
ncbi:hypothetical protein PYW08_000122 [Mythimna loreyi]|uniref:Uncharacterized protein n=1 Tax=Mythimna loreyi TaxID=667449 RepID=A0ACC2RBD1_9NEOP|nr:hypothetical protein PYW08_000122 [Mythimna loreyi]